MVIIASLCIAAAVDLSIRVDASYYRVLHRLASLPLSALYLLSYRAGSFSPSHSGHQQEDGQSADQYGQIHLELPLIHKRHGLLDCKW